MINSLITLTFQQFRRSSSGGRPVSSLNHRSSRGFTIVELLIVIVVIAILAAITIVAYNGVRDRARAVSAQAALNQMVKKIALYAIDNSDEYPATLSSVGITSTSDTSYRYTYNNSSSTKIYCVSATVGSTSYYQSSDTGAPVLGSCPVTNLVSNPSLESDSTGWSAPGNSAPTLSRSSDTAQVGSAALKVVYNSPGYNTDSNQQRFCIGATSTVVGQTYTVSAYVHPSAGKRFQLYITDSSNGGGIMGPLSTTSATWQRLSFTFTANDTTQQVCLTAQEGLQNSGLTSSITDYTVNPFVGYVDAVMLTLSDTLLDYADGNSPNWIWSGVVNDSTSKGPPR